VAVFFLAATGIALNHMGTLFTSNKYITSNIVLDWYGVEPARLVLAADTDSAQNVVWSDGTIIINRHAVLYNQARLLDVIERNGILHLITANGVHLFTLGRERIESIEFEGKRFVLSVLSNVEPSHVRLDSETKSYLFNLDALEFISDLIEDIPQAGRQQLMKGRPSVVKEQGKESKAYSQSRNFSLLKSKVLQDVHSGRFFGQAGAWLMDLFAILFMLLAGSGIYIWLGRANKVR
jgi:hypothetical protein